MKKNTIIFFTLFLSLFLIITTQSVAQIEFSKMTQIVFKENKKGKDFTFDNSKISKAYDHTILKYLGLVKVSYGKIFKVLTYEHIWGPNHHTTGIIYIFNSENKYIGEYYLGDGFQLPGKLKQGKLFFTNEDDDDCDKKQITIISLKKGLPKTIFIKCKGELGDVYSFSSEN